MTPWNEQPEETQFTPEEWVRFLSLVKKLGWKHTGKEVFEAFFPIFPLALCDLAVIREIDTKTHVLLWYRDDEHYKGWHMPGGYILRGESWEDAARRVLLKETSLTLQRMKFLHCFNWTPVNAPVPNHQIALLFLCAGAGKHRAGTFFPLDAIPSDTLSHHKEYLKYISHIKYQISDLKLE